MRATQCLDEQKRSYTKKHTIPAEISAQRHSIYSTGSSPELLFLNVHYVSLNKRQLKLRNVNYTVSQKTRHQTLGHNFTNYYPILKKNFTGGLGIKFATNSYLNIPPRFKHVATLPRGI